MPERKSIIKCSNWDYEGEIEFAFMSYVYLHGDAETNSGFDCCEGNIEAFRNIVKNHLYLATLLNKDKTESDVLVIPCFNERRMTALVCLCEDHESIHHALNEYYEGHFIDTCMFEHEKEFLYEKYPKVREVIHNFNRTR